MSDTTQGTCDYCGYAGTNVRWVRYPASTRGDNENNGRILCDLCCGTAIGTYDEYALTKNKDTVDILRTICYVGNAIIAAIKAQAKGDVS